MENAFTDLLISINVLLIGFMLFALRKKAPQYAHFLESMTMLMTFMSVVAPTISVLSEYQGGMYFFIPIYLTGINGWLLFARYAIFDKNKWHTDISFKPVRVTWFVLMGGFFPGVIAFVVFAPYISNWALP